MGRGIACDIVGKPPRYFKRKNPPIGARPTVRRAWPGLPQTADTLNPDIFRMQFPPSNNRRELKNRGISTIRFQNLKYGQGNCMRRCWGTTPISGEVGLAARLHPLRRAAPVTWRYTRYVALHPLRRAAPDQNGCIAYGSGALPTDRVHRTTLEHTTEDSAAPARITHGQELTKPQEPRAPPATTGHGLTRNTSQPTGRARKPHPRHNEAATGFPATASSRSLSGAQRSATDQAVMSTWSSTAARPASRRATGTRNGEQDT